MRSVLLIVALLCAVALATPTYYTVLKSEDGTFSVEEGRNTTGVAIAQFDNAISTTGWAFLTVRSNSEYADSDQMYGAGFLEGSITTDLIWSFYQNIYAGEYNSAPLPSLVDDFINTNLAFMTKNVQANPEDPYWAHVGLIMNQLTGLMDGYNAAVANDSMKLTMVQFMQINMDGDMADVTAAINVTGIDWSNDTAVIERYIRNSHCSSLVKVADDLTDIYAGHTTWEGYEEMVRVFKTYDLPISVNQSSQVVMFSGYPGALSSIDDYYQTDAKLVVTETTNGVMNNTLYKAVTPNAVLSWVRVIVSNKMASNGRDWVNIFSKYNSGTYNNQWIVVDMKRLVSGSHLEPGTLWILEQIPGYIESADVTETLTYGYWPSYNVPYFANIYNVSGFAYYAENYGPMFSYENNPRGEIFRRDANTVNSMDGIRAILRYNDYKHDPLSMGSPANAISSRFDLVTSGSSSNPYLTPDAFGGVDSKVTSAKWVNVMACSVESCPTHDNLPPFSWSQGAFNDQVHVGQPDVWDFGWVDARYIADGSLETKLH